MYVIKTLWAPRTISRPRWIMIEPFGVTESSLAASVESVVSLLRARNREHATACGALVQAFGTRLLAVRNRLRRGESPGEDSAVEWVRHASLYGVCLSGAPVRETGVMGDLIAVELCFETSQIPTDELRVRLKPVKTKDANLVNLGTDAVLKLPHEITLVKYIKEHDLVSELDTQS